VNNKTHRYTTGKADTEENIEWAKANWESFLNAMIRKQAAKKAERRKQAREAQRQTAKEAIANQSSNALTANGFNGDIMPAIAQYGAYSLKAEAYSRKDNTNIKYGYVFRRRIVPSLGDLRLDEIKPSHIKKWQSDLTDSGLSVPYIRQCRLMLSLIIKEAIADELIDRNPLSMVKPPKGQSKERKPFTAGEISRLLRESYDNWFRDFFILSLFTGLRTGEAFALEWEYIDFNNKTIGVRRTISGGFLGAPKTPSSVRDVEMLPIVERALRRQYIRTGHLSSFVFVNKCNRMFKDWSYIRKTLWKPLLEQCNLEYRVLYTTRHTFASLMLSESEEPMWVSAMLGHKNMSITLSVYAKYLPRRYVKRAGFLDGAEWDIGAQGKAKESEVDDRKGANRAGLDRLPSAEFGVI
jgi:integrase